MMIKVLVQVYKNRHSKPPFEFNTIGEFSFDDKELDKYRPDEAMFQVLTRKLYDLGYGFRLKFWSGEKDGVISATLFNQGE